jgi:hypothetical protein
VFRDFIKLADIDTINAFLTATTFTSESENIKLLWERAYEEGYENGRKVALPVLHRVRTKLEEKFEHGVKRGMDLGREEGYNIAKGAFDKMVTKMKARDTTKVDTSDAGTQTDPPTTTTTSISVQTNLTKLVATSQLPEHPEYRKGTKIGEISFDVVGFSSPAPSVTSTNSPAPSTTSPVLETCKKKG